MQLQVKRGKQILFLLISFVCFVLMIWANYLFKIDKNTKNDEENVESEKRRICYTRNVTDNDETVEFFPKLSKYFIQPKSNDAIFFIDANCSLNGLLDISQR